MKRHKARAYTVNDPLYGPRYASPIERVVIRLRRLARRYAAAVTAPEAAADRIEGEAI